MYIHGIHHVYTWYTPCIYMVYTEIRCVIVLLNLWASDSRPQYVWIATEAPRQPAAGVMSLSLRG
jgi:hypothetical protein